MPEDPVTLHDGAIYKFVRQNCSWREPEFWESLREAVDQMTNADRLLAEIESDLRWVVEQEGELRPDPPDVRSERRRHRASGGPADGHDLEIAGSDLRAVFKEPPSFRALMAIDLLRAVGNARRLLKQHPGAACSLVQGFALGLSMEQLRVMDYEPDVERGQKVKRGASRGGRARRIVKAQRDNDIVAAFLGLRRAEPERTDTWRCDQIGPQFGLKRETVRGIVNRAIRESGPRSS